MSFITRTIGSWSESLSLQALAGEVYAPDDVGAGPPKEPANEEGSGETSPPEEGGSPPKGKATPPEGGPQAQPGPPPAAINVTGVEGTVAGLGGVSGATIAALSGATAGGFVFRPTPLPQIPATAASAAPVGPSTVFVEVGSALEQAAISRNGVQVPIVQINPATLQTALGNTITLPARVVSQSIAPGVSVAKGTSVDITLTEPTKLNVGVLQNPFQPLIDQPLDTVFKTFIRDNPAVQSVLARNTSGTALNQVDQATITEALGANNPVTTTAGQTIDAAFDTLQAAFTFGT